MEDLTEGLPRPRRVLITSDYNDTSLDPLIALEKNFTYTDCASGESDSVSITVCNRDMRWLNEWQPKKGDKFSITLKTFCWNVIGQENTFFCGKFCCDDISFSGPVLTCTIGAVSVPENQAFRCTAKTKTWNNVTIEEIGRQIAGEYGLEFYYNAPKFCIETIEQNEKTDADFLTSVCEDYGLFVKLYFGKIILYDADLIEETPPVIPLKLTDFENWTYNTTLNGTYTGAQIKYTNGKDNKEIVLSVGEGNRILNINEKVDSLADAQIKICAKVNNENRKAETITGTIMGDFRIIAGTCIEITDAFMANGKYFVDKVVHQINENSVYKMDLELHKVQPKIRL